MTKAIWKKNPIKILACTDLLCSLASPKEFLPLNSARARFGTRSGENKRRGALHLTAVHWEHVACGLSQSALVPLAVPADARAAGGASGPDSQRLFSVHPCPARAGAWDASQIKTQAVDIISEGVQCHAEKGSCCPSC